ncbi:hypothetical protein CEXT_731891 [Caerostris extrusa]|uniref:Uncharacterized protein n=1 Tax=Caerostris extrusa TaxID=172846 RepID=A0AAV4UF82_CAEEX|nr:hypothetical protein CEXT_731891 [Caerostris extrusa]
MHPALQGFNIITWYLILATEETAIKFMQEVGLIPTYLSPCPACPLCGSETKSQKMPSRKLGFRYVCSERSKKKMLRNGKSTKNTIMENSKLPFRDVLMMSFAFVKNASN